MQRPSFRFRFLLASLTLLVAGIELTGCASTPRTANTSAGGTAGTTSGGGSSGVHAGGSDAGVPLIDAGPLTPDLTARFPVPDATGVCVDAQLRLDFGAPVALGTSGKIQVFSTADPSIPVDMIDMAATTSSATIAGRAFKQLRPVYLDGQRVVIYLKPHSLAPNQTYFVTIDPTVFTDASGAFLGSLQGDSAWRFTTGAGVPANPAAISVMLDGSGDFCSVQGAVDAVPPATTDPKVITLGNGTYREIVLVTNKRNLTIRGTDRKQTISAYANNEALQGGAGTKFRAMFNAEAVQDLTIENLTLHNLTP
jgi:pectin methylesterase-like acyl-CoA thioesterase